MSARAVVLAGVALVAGAAGVAIGIRRERRAVARLLVGQAQEYVDQQA